MCIHIADSLNCTAETQHCKVIIPQFLKKEGNRFLEVFFISLSHHAFP